MRLVLFLPLVCLAILVQQPSRLEAQDAGVAPSVRAPSPCAEPSVATLFARVPEAEREGYFAQTRPERDEDDVLHEYLSVRPRVLEVELDGQAPREAVLGLNTGEAEEESGSSVWVFTCQGSSWDVVGRIELEISEGWSGTLDTEPGLAVLRAETIAGIDHDLLRLEHVDVRGSYDPRFTTRRFVLLHVVSGSLVTALDVVVSEIYEGGPAREETSSATRTLILRPGTARTPPRYRLVVVLTEGEERRRTGRRSTWLVFDGRTFVPR
ncbi:MAG: hypothetical protein J0L92_28185 [Deltaproteobacteria bacterium]|nr:hypothetical protein [Deltaproteobacteria bacterium]